ncbi:hypothetical protein RJT34_30952 [Clitoria ternatea]|uniref:Uncharacterized protein n=1 Tax=Clitoria ternatea TaxID=43366 RepID=A0AAN9I350_CLITE
MKPQDEEIPLSNYSLISSSPDIPVASETIVMLSPPLTQDQDAAPQDVFSTPPEDSLPPSSSDDICDYSDAQMTHEIRVAEPSHAAPRESPTCKLDEIRDMKGAFSPLKKPKLWEQDLGLGSLEDCFGAQLQKKLQEGKVVSDDCGRDILMDKDLGSVEGSGTKEKSDEEPPEVSVLPSPIQPSLFDVMKVLEENLTSDVEENLDDLSLLEVAQLRGITFPRPRWWPDEDDDDFNLK